MLGFFFEAGPRLGAPRLFSRPLSDGRLGHWATGSAGAVAANPNHHSTLASNEGFEAVPNCALAHNYTLAKLEAELTNQGPIFMYWFKHANNGPVNRTTRQPNDGSYGHASVIVGTTEDAIIYHDPEFANRSQGANRKMSLAQFNNTRQVWQWALMQKAGITAARVRDAIAFHSEA